MKLSKILKSTAILLLWLVVWQLAAVLINQEILIPTPLATFRALLVMCRTGKFYMSVLLSLLRIIAGYTAGVASGIICGILSYRFKTFKAVFSPILQLVKAVPVASFIILALVWLHAATLPIFISFLMVLPMIWTNVETGLSGIDKKYLEMAEVYKIDKLKVFFQIKMPFIMPSLISASLTALGFAWKSVIAAEVICRPKNSLGKMLQESKPYNETPEVFALTAVVALLSMLLELVIRRTLRRYTHDNPR